MIRTPVSDAIARLQVFNRRQLRDPLGRTAPAPSDHWHAAFERRIRVMKFRAQRIPIAS